MGKGQVRNGDNKGGRKVCGERTKSQKREKKPLSEKSHSRRELQKIKKDSKKKRGGEEKKRECKKTHLLGGRGKGQGKGRGLFAARATSGEKQCYGSTKCKQMKAEEEN